MSYTKLIDCLKRCSTQKLQSFLGDDLLTQYQFEWEEQGELLTKKRLAEMIIQLNGVEILKNAEFRRAVMLHMDEANIDDVFSTLSLSKKKNVTTTEEKIHVLSSLTWSASDTNYRLLDILGINRSILDPVEVDTQVKYVHGSGQRFYELLDYQFVIKQRVLAELDKPYPLKRMLVHMPTGTGKTKTTMHTAVHYFNFSMKKEGTIIWLAHTTELLQQAYETFCDVWSHLGDGEIDVYKLWGNREIIVPRQGLNGIIICGIQKLQSIRTNRPELFEKIVQDTKLIIFDEAHKAAAKETRQLVEAFMIKPDNYNDRSLIGLTATPGRTSLGSDENKLLSNMFENNLIGIDVDVVNQINMSQEEFLNCEYENNIIKYFQQARILAKIKKEQLAYNQDFTQAELNKIKTKMNDNGYSDFTESTLKIIGQNRSRNKAIMQKLRELSTQQIPTIVFACSVAHAKLLSFMLSLEDIPNALILGEMNPADRAESIAAFKDRENPINIIINYEVLTTGFDSTNIKCVFITRPTQSIVLYSQMLGRGLRGPKMGGNEECLLIDIKDNLGKYDAEMAFNHFDTYWN